jgi:hypothetical protein
MRNCGTDVDLKSDRKAYYRKQLIVLNIDSESRWYLSVLMMILLHFLLVY